VFRKTAHEGFVSTVSKLVTVPLLIVQDNTIPIQHNENWNRKRAAVVPVLIVFAYLWLNGYMQDNNEADNFSNNKYFFIGLICFIPGGIIGAFIQLRTKVSECPQWLTTINGILAFVMSIMWI
jgi:sodium/potassium/calcium exchanger 6